jgi:antitoxin VapB
MEIKFRFMGMETIHIKNGKGIQTITIPKEMRINDDKVYLKQVGNTLHIIPFHNPWQNLIESTSSFTPDFMEERNQTFQQERDSFDDEIPA